MPSRILDVHERSRNDNGLAVRKEVVDGLQRPSGARTLPTMLLYDERGLRLYDNITTEAPEYYLFAAEEEILKNKADEIVRVMHAGAGVFNNEVVLELGSGALRKTSHILRSLAGLVENPSPQEAPIKYYALDLEERELDRTLGQINSSELGHSLQGKVLTGGFWGTYTDGLKFVQSGGLRCSSTSVRSSTSALSHRDFDMPCRDISPDSRFSSSSSTSSMDPDSSSPSTPEEIQPPLHLMFLGSSVGNFSREEGTEFLHSLPLRPGSGDTLLLGLDHDNAQHVIEAAYNDAKGCTTNFIMNGLKGASRVLGNEDLFDLNKWEYVNKYNPAERRHEAFFRCKQDHDISDPEDGAIFHFFNNELIKIEQSLKFSDTDAYKLFFNSGLRPIQRWMDSHSQYSLWLLERPAFSFPLLSSPSVCNSKGFMVAKKHYSTSPFGVPSPQEWENLWTLWDFITQRMIPPSMLFQKPIDLRHICLFYLGHIPTFLDIHLSRLLNEPHSEPESFKTIFERGIDPIVDDPTQCHPHSKVPEKNDEWPTLTTILQFQSRVRNRVLKLYENIDAGKWKLDRKTGRVLFMTFEHEALHAETLLYMLLQRAGSGTAPPIGFSAPEWPSLKQKWATDPKPSCSTVMLGPATISLGHDDSEADDANASDVSEHEYGWDNEHPARQVDVGPFRIEWRPVTNGEFHAFYRSNDAEGVEFPSTWIEVDGSVQVRTLYGPVPLDVAQEWPVIATYNALSRYAIVKGGRLPTEPELRLFYDKFSFGYEGGTNIGFRNWHPVPATTGGDRNGGKGCNGGIWEWTSTSFDHYDGFVPSPMYPGYSKDFFDGAHQVVIGGSYATIPRIAERRSVRNWYQRNYPYPWVGGRVVYDM